MHAYGTLHGVLLLLLLLLLDLLKVGASQYAQLLALS